MISDFISKLIMTKQASFTEKEIEILDLNFSMQPLLSLVKFQNEIKDEERMEKLGYFFSESIISHFKERFAIEEKNMTSLWTNLFNMSGFGKVQVVDVTKDKTILKLEKNNFAELYTKEYGIQKQPVCHLLAGIFKNFIEKTSGKKVECKEISCTAMGNRVCTFELRPIR